MFYTYVGDLEPIAGALDLDVEAVDVVFHYWLLKRKVGAFSVCLLYCVLHISAHSLISSVLQYSRFLTSFLSVSIPLCPQLLI